MEARLERLETEQRAIMKRVEDLEKAKEETIFTLKDLRYETTIMHAIVVTRLDELKIEIGKIGDRLIRLDDRVTEAHTEIAELRIDHAKRFDRIEGTMATKDDITRLEATTASKDDISALKDTQNEHAKRFDSLDQKIDLILEQLNKTA